MSTRTTTGALVDYIRDTIAAIDGTGDYEYDLTGRVSIGQPTRTDADLGVAIHTITWSAVEAASARLLQVTVTMQIDCFTGATGTTSEGRILDAAALASDVSRAVCAALIAQASPALFGRIDGGYGDEGSTSGTARLQVSAYFHTTGAL